MSHKLACQPVLWRNFLNFPSSQVTLACLKFTISKARQNKKTTRKPSKSQKAGGLSVSAHLPSVCGYNWMRAVSAKPPGVTAAYPSDTYIRGTFNAGKVRHQNPHLPAHILNAVPELQLSVPQRVRHSTPTYGATNDSASWKESSLNKCVLGNTGLRRILVYTAKDPLPNAHIIFQLDWLSLRGPIETCRRHFLRHNTSPAR